MLDKHKLCKEKSKVEFSIEWRREARIKSSDGSSRREKSKVTSNEIENHFGFFGIKILEGHATRQLSRRYVLSIPLRLSLSFKRLNLRREKHSK